MHFKGFLLYFVCLVILLSSNCDRGKDKYDYDEALRRVVTVQKLQNYNPGDPAVVPQMSAIIDSMSNDGKDACYFGAVNVLIDRLFSDDRFSEADSLAVRMQQEAIHENDSLSIAMSKRVRAQILYKLSQSTRALEEIISAIPYVTEPLKSNTHFGTATSLQEWTHIIAQDNPDSSLIRKAGKTYADLVKRFSSENYWTDPTAHYPVTSLAF